LTVVVLAVAGWMYAQGRMALVMTSTEAGAPAAGVPAPLPGFRADAWYLPEGPLAGFVEIPAGMFLMGSDPARDTGAFDNERWSPELARGTLELGTFYMNRYEVTVAQFRAFAETTGYAADAQALAGPPDHPVVAVSWPDALAYCRWLEQQLLDHPDAAPALSRVLADDLHIALPTEAEWEKAARGTEGRIYPWGEIPRRDRANYGATSTTPVGSFACPECPFGLLDTSGNAWEWTRSPYQPYPYDPTDDRDDLDSDALWVMRGGHFGDPARYVRAAVRGGADPGVHRPFIGFRLAIVRLEP
jgi:formylglycine-generating enzyme required for sulfatase activity